MPHCGPCARHGHRRATRFLGKPAVHACWKSCAWILHRVRRWVEPIEVTVQGYQTPLRRVLALLVVIALLLGVLYYWKYQPARLPHLRSEKLGGGEPRRGGLGTPSGGEL